MTTTQHIDSIFPSLFEDDEDQNNEKDLVNRMIGQLKSMNRVRLFSFILQGDSMRQCKYHGIYEALLYSKVGKGNEEYTKSLIQLIEEFEWLIREGLSTSLALDQLIDDGYLKSLDKLQSINKLN